MSGAGDRVFAAWLAAADAQRVMRALAAGGAPARFVGGCVRDAVFAPGSDTVDIDIATPELPERAMELLRAAGLEPLPTGLRHGTVSLHRPGRRFEITTLRRDVACDGRHAMVEFTDDFAADAARRDFTINAMSCEQDGTLHDPMGGRGDLAAGRVRFVGDARRRIAEDHLRILRFFRFHARFGRGLPDAEALAACAELAAAIRSLSGERIRQELWRILSGPRPAATLGLMQATAVLAHVVPGAVALDHLDRLTEPEVLLRLAALIRPSPSQRVEALADRLRLANHERERLIGLVTTALPDMSADLRTQRQALHRLGAALYADLVRLARAAGEVDDVLAERLLVLAAGWQVPEFPLGGADLLALGVPPGPGLGHILATVRRAWEDADFALDREACAALAAKLVASGRHLTP